MGQYIDWRAVRTRWKAGETSYRISKSLGGEPTRQGIEKRAKRENWTQTETVTGDGNNGNSRTWLEKVGDYKSIGPKDTPEARAIILSELANGAPLLLASKLAGVHRDTLHSWRTADPTFAAMVREAQRQVLSSQVKNIIEAGNNGDWKASAYILERHNESREDFAPPARGNGFGAVNVTLNVIRGEGVTIDGEVIEGTAQQIDQQ